MEINKNATSGTVYISNSQGLEIDCTWKLENSCVNGLELSLFSYHGYVPDCKNFYWEIQYDSDISSHREHFCIQEKTTLWLNARQSRVRLVGRLQGKVYKNHYKNLYPKISIF